MKAKMKISLAVLSVLLLGAILLSGCYVFLEYDPPDPHYVPVENVEIVSSSGIKIDNPGGVRGFNLQLKTAVSPANATNQNITWSVVEDGDGTGARFVRNVLVIPPDDDGTAPDTTILVQATITGGGKIRAEDYTKKFTIAVTGEFLPVTNINIDSASCTTGNPFPLTGTVNPSDATAKQQLESEGKPVITWSVKNAGGTGAVIAVVNDGADYILRTTTAGTVIVTATVQNGKAPGEDYTQDFEISVTGTFVAVTGIINGPSAFLVGTYDLMGTVIPSNASCKDIIWELVDGGGTGAHISSWYDADDDCDYYSLTTTSTGTTGVVTVRARIRDGRGNSGDYTQNFNIEIHTTASAIPVTNITGIPTSIEARVPLALTGTVVPANASFKQIEWSVVNAGKTEAEIIDGSLITAKRGTVTIRATIVNGKGTDGDYTQDFTIGVKGLVVYVVGCVPSGRVQACYWEFEDGAATRYDLPGSDGSYSRATGVVAAADGTVYISGYTNGPAEYGPNGTGYGNGCYWTIPANGDPVTKTDLSGGQARAITLLGNDLYVACEDRYYKNSVPTLLQTISGTVYSRVLGIGTNGTEVYVTGYCLDEATYTYKSCYWDTDGNVHILVSDAVQITQATCVAFVNGNPYIVGYWEDDWNSQRGSTFQPCYWDAGNGDELHNLPRAGIYDRPYAVFTSGTDWYVAGGSSNVSTMTSFKPCYWKNGVLQLMATPPAGELKAITLLNGVIYTTGWAYINYRYVPACWINGESYLLGSYLDQYEENSAVGIAVVDDR